jgi:hypothetical protein
VLRRTGQWVEAVSKTLTTYKYVMQGSGQVRP